MNFGLLRRNADDLIEYAADVDEPANRVASRKEIVSNIQADNRHLCPGALVALVQEPAGVDGRQKGFQKVFVNALD